jgi:hypothetical protein
MLRFTTGAFVVLLSLYGIPALQAADNAPVTYAKDIAPILFKECVACHRPGEVAPFSLLNYQDAAKRAKMLAKVTKQRFMPPWKAEHGYGKFKDERYLTDAQIELIKQWADAGASKDWILGKPDVIATMPQPFALKADGKDVQRAFAIPINLPEDRYLVGFEFRAGNPQIVHHSIISRDTNGEAGQRDAADPQPGYKSFGGTGTKEGWNGVLGVWTPGIIPTRLPEDVGIEIKKGSGVVIEIHYHPSGKAESDQSSVALYFSKTPPQSIARYTFMHQPRIAIPAGDKAHKITLSHTIPATGVVLSVMPHMHLLGKRMQVSYTMPDGSVTPMVRVNDWDFRWQNQYFYATPLRLPRGARVDLEAVFDNSADNPAQPQQPPKLVTFGEETTNEMAGIIALVTPFVPAPGSKKATLDAAVLAQYEGRYDFGAGRIVTIKREGTRLIAESTNKRAELLPESERVFFTQPDEGIFTFKKDAAGKMISCQIDRQGIALVGPIMK